MSLNHGINTYKSDTDFSAVVEAAVGIPFFIGAWPCHTGKGYTGKPQIATSFTEAKELGGFSKEWRDANGDPKWNLCQAMYSQFKLFGVGPAIFMNLFDPATHKTAVTEASFTVKDHVATLPLDAIDDTGLVVKDTASPANTLVKGTDYDVIYGDNACFVELISTSSHYSDASLKIAYNTANPGAITASDVAAAVEKIEECKSLFNIVPDLICAPGWSATASVALVMAAKAASINGIYRAKAVVDLDTSTAGADDYSEVLTKKNANGYTDENMIVCWPLVKVDTDVFDLSVIVCGSMGRIDQSNGDCPYESPSNKYVPITGACVKAGTEITLTLPQADVVSYSDGVVTVINNGGWLLWGNYTGCWPSSTDVAKYFICTSRMQDWICNTFVNTFWNYIDRPLTRVMIDAIVNSFNSWLSGLTHESKLYGGEIQFVEENNPTVNLIAGKFRLDTKEASPVPAQEIDMYVEYDIDYLTAALSA
jgi:phage tail sheath protein FI